MRRRSALVALGGAFLAACASHPAHIVAHGPGFVIHSPFDEAATDRWRELVARETTTVARFFGVARPTSPIEVHLEPIDVTAGANVLAEVDPRVDGIGGWATDASEIHLVVSAKAGGLLSTTIDRKLRHELAHVFARGLGLNGPPWLDEGLAHEVEDVVQTEAGVRLHPAPVPLLQARGYAAGFAMSKVWHWDGRRAPNEEKLRTLARSCVRFLIERAEPGTWWSRVRQAASLTSAERSSLEAEWRAWLTDLDLVARIERAIHDPDPSLRSAAAAALPGLAALERDCGGRLPGEPTPLGHRLDPLALALIRDPACAEPASRYLVFFRSQALSGGVIEALEASTESLPRLIAAAVRARRGQPYDAEEARALWGGLSNEDRARLAWVPRVLFGTRRPSRRAATG